MKSHRLTCKIIFFYKAIFLAVPKVEDLVGVFEKLTTPQKEETCRSSQWEKTGAKCLNIFVIIKKTKTLYD